jgi:NAD(P)H-hydrate epimerase
MQIESVIAAVYLHGLSGELGVAELGEKCLIATDLLRYLPEAIRACEAPSH